MLRRSPPQVATALCSWDTPEPLVKRGPWQLVLASDVLHGQRNCDGRGEKRSH